MLKYEHYNPVDEKGGCIVRTMSKLFDKDYEIVKEELISLSKELGYEDYHETEVFEKYLEKYNYEKQELNIFVSELNLKGKYAVLCHKGDNYHMFAIIDGVVYDKSLKYLDMEVVCLYKFNN
ncbi:MAG: hypothetical protein IJI22_03295 [Bacilli bacterium]|nr:hypothetical protein [Bacilli bacterium]